MPTTTGPSTEGEMMQTFLTSRDLAENAQRLDSKRLGKQRIECVQILRALKEETKGWRHHPATLMWDGYEEALNLYLRTIIHEWKRRGFNNSIDCSADMILRINQHYMGMRIEMPHWWDDERVFASHRANLLRKDPDYYGKFGWKESPNLPYFWPVTKEDVALRRAARETLEWCL